MTERLSPQNPVGYEQTVFTVPDLPAVPFTTVEITSGDKEGPYPEASAWSPIPPSNMMYCGNGADRPYYWCVLSQNGDQIEVVDQVGVVHKYVIVPLQDNSMPADDASLTPAQIQLAKQQGALT